MLQSGGETFSLLPYNVPPTKAHTCHHPPTHHHSWHGLFSVCSEGCSTPQYQSISHHYQLNVSQPIHLKSKRPPQIILAETFCQFSLFTELALASPPLIVAWSRNFVIEIFPLSSHFFRLKSRLRKHFSFYNVYLDPCYPGASKLLLAFKHNVVYHKLGSEI